MNFFGEMAKVLNLIIANTDIRTPVNSPYAVYFVASENNIYANGIIVYSEKSVNFELYHEKADLNIEYQVEQYFKQHKIGYSKSNSWVTEDELVMTIYEINFERNEVL